MQTVTFEVPGQTGPQVIDTLCFEPAAMIFRMSEGGLGYSSSNTFQSLGFADAALNQYVVGTREDNGVNPNGFWGFTYPYTGNCIQIGTSGGNLTGVQADGFTINWGTSSGTGWLVECIAFGGDTCQAKAMLTNPTGTGNLPFTGVGFQGQLLMMLHSRGQTWNTETSVRMNLDFGFATGSASDESFAVNDVSSSGSSPSNSQCNFRFGFVDDWAHTTFVSWDADGYTVNMTGNMGGVNVPVLVLGDSAETSYKVDNGTQKTTTGLKAYTGAGFTPGGLLASGVCGTNTTGAGESHSYMTFGAYDGAEQHNAWGGSVNVQNPTVTATRHADVFLSHSDAPSTTNAEAIVDSLDSDGMTLDWTTADATARAFGIVYFKTIEGNPCPSRGGRFYATLV